MENQLDNFFHISFDNSSRESLRKIAIWARVCAICAFLGYLIALLFAFFGKSPAENAEGMGFGAAMGRGSLIAGAFISAIIGGAINYFLYKFAVDAKAGIENMDQVKLNEGLSSFKTYFKIVGIILLIALILMALFMVIAIISFGVRGS
jgi:hypothetical protein